ncbi:uncharacterized protein LOC112689407 [Sipha flava]|uniref:Uncharacterized protein LOC112689407 n=3 Tax=Sipha flava TaxID=143950 RepID=A0A8B8G8F2_9HEMI|nr:uncharacterized protein LOC112689407 [Sipha flava]
MLKTCFGCCPLRNGVSVIAIVNIIWNILMLLLHVKHRTNQYSKIDFEERNTTLYDDDKKDSFQSTQWQKISALTDIFMDYIFIFAASWIALELISNIALKQSTFKQAPHKIYVWLTVYSANLLFMLIHLAYYMSIIIKHSIRLNNIDIMGDDFGNFYQKLMYIIIILFEITIIYSYYITEHNERLNTHVQLKWKYISKGKIESQGVDIAHTSAFMTSTSRQTQERSKLPPYITNVLQDSYVVYINSSLLSQIFHVLPTLAFRVIMLYSCFGCCSIRTGINYITFFNMLWITIAMMINFIVRSTLNEFHHEIRIEQTPQTFNDQQDSNETVQLTNLNSTTDILDLLGEPTLLMSDLFLDYILIVRTAFHVMEFYLNVSLKQSSYTVSPQRIYAWLVIYYFNLGEAIIVQCMEIGRPSFSMDFFKCSEFFHIIVIGVESYVVQSYYNQQKLAAVDNYVALKWKYLPEPKMKFNKSANTTTITTMRCDLPQDESDYIPIFVKNIKNCNH